MLLRPDGDRRVCITQPAHAWVSGQLAAAWGRPPFARPQPWNELVLATRLHDLAWQTRDQNPHWNPATRWPRTFMEVPLDEHLALWRAAGPLAETIDPYVALLVSLHGTTLYRMNEHRDQDSPQGAAVRQLLAELDAFQQDCRARLAQAGCAPARLAPAHTEHLRRLLALWDWMSLVLLGGRARTVELESPTPLGNKRLQLSVDAGGTAARLAPWPFVRPALTLRCRGRVLDAPTASPAALDAAWRLAPLRTVTLRLTPR